MSENNYFSKNLRYLREKNNVEQIQLANHLGRKSGTSVSEWESGKYTPKAGTLNEIAKYFRVTMSDLMEKDLSKTATNVIPYGNTVNIPVLGVITCGDPILAEQNIIDYKEEIADNLPSGELFYLQTKGNSMTPTIPENSFVMIRKQETVENNEIAAVLVNGDTEATLKRVRFQGDTIILMPDNSEHNPIIANEENPVRIIGKAIKVSIDL
ncbi:LexA family protein [Vagococcus fluvialis]|uniref:LexA family protein n=1 Tax=Vagococcus fluvialis TaxID=2738 RepID=UPI001D0A43E3|nr:XRE family transcriptional regulator [Vagococcus fluvialis]UDM75014.1 XRE family transcriptional regulator [Vagococcus fluvialis]